MMKVLVFAMLLLTAAAACDTRSGIAKRDMEKYVSSPEPPRSPSPEPSPIDPADAIVGDDKLDGKPVNINGRAETVSGKCDEFNRVMVNGDGNTVTITGACRQIMVNGDGNQITADGAVSFVFNGVDNVVRHSRFVNGKYPTVTQNRPGNTVEKVSAEAAAEPAKNKAK